VYPVRFAGIAPSKHTIMKLALFSGSSAWFRRPARLGKVGIDFYVRLREISRVGRSRGARIQQGTSPAETTKLISEGM
jgi:hypothetical protein